MLVLADWKRSGLFRDAVLFAAVAMGVLVVLSTELLGGFRVLTFGAIVCFWVVALAGAGLYGLVSKAAGPSWSSLKISRQILTGMQWMILVWCGIYVLLIAGLALMCPPNVWDGLTYHMSRVMHWIQQQSVAFYPTHILRQLHLSPGAEYAILHAQLLSGGDRFANMVQWSALVGCLLAGSRVAKILGGQRTGQLLSVVFILTLPAGILQASNVQTDFVVSFWLILLLGYLLQLIQQPSLRGMLLAGGCLGLAVFIKGTAFLFAAPLVLGYMAFAWRGNAKKYVFSLVIIGSMTCLINGPFWLRNQQFYGSPLGPGQEGAGAAFKYTNDRLSAGVLLSNISRNLALHAVQPLPAVRTGVEKGVRVLHERLQLDIDDPATTWTGTAFYISDRWDHEVHAGNPLHVLLVVACGIGMCWPKWFRGRERRGLIWMSFGAACIGMLLFCLLLRWQPWGTRLHLPFFVLVWALCVVRLLAVGVRTL